MFSRPGPGKSRRGPQLCACVSLDEPFKSILPLQEPPRCKFTLRHAGAKHNTDGRDVARNSREIHSAKKKNICSRLPNSFFFFLNPYNNAEGSVNSKR